MLPRRYQAAPLAALMLAFAALPAFGFTPNINYTDAANTGFKDPTPVSPVGGNSGTTLGGQRKQAFEFAVNVWAQRLQSSIVVTINADWTQQFCDVNSAALGSAGPELVLLQGNVAYPQALANALVGTDTDPSEGDINAHFNKDVDAKPVPCLGSLVFYYGLDQNNGSDVNFVDVAIHELGHGLGFVSLMDPETGASMAGDNIFSILDHSLFDEQTSMLLPSENDSQRAAVAISGSSLTWNATHTNAGASFLTAGRTNGHVRMFAPNPPQGGSSISHWDVSATPDLVMEPVYTGNAEGRVDLTTCAFKDIGWTLLGGVACPDVASDEADLALTSADAPDPVVAGRNVVYTVVLTNNGPGTAQDVSVTDTLPPKTTFISLAKSSGWSATTPAVGANGSFTFTRSSLASGGKATFKITAHVASGTKKGTVLTNSAAVTSATTDPAPGNDAASASTIVVTNADLSVSGADSPDPVHAGDEVTYTITVDNAGPSSAGAVAVTDTLPSRATFVSASAPSGWTVAAPAVGATGKVKFTKPGLARNRPVQLTVVARISNAVADHDSIRNNLKVASSATDPKPDDNTAVVSTVVLNP